MLTFLQQTVHHVLFMNPQIPLFSNFFIKNGSHSTIYTFKNYFATVISAISFQFQQNKSYPNKALLRFDLLKWKRRPFSFPHVTFHQLPPFRVFILLFLIHLYFLKCYFFYEFKIVIDTLKMINHIFAMPIIFL